MSWVAPVLDGSEILRELVRQFPSMARAAIGGEALEFGPELRAAGWSGCDGKPVAFNPPHWTQAKG